MSGGAQEKSGVRGQVSSLLRRSFGEGACLAEALAEGACFAKALAEGACLAEAVAKAGYDFFVAVQRPP